MTIGNQTEWLCNKCRMVFPFSKIEERGLSSDLSCFNFGCYGFIGPKDAMLLRECRAENATLKKQVEVAKFSMDHAISQMFVSPFACEALLKAALAEIKRIGGGE